MCSINLPPSGIDGLRAEGPNEDRKALTGVEGFPDRLRTLFWVAVKDFRMNCHSSETPLVHIPTVVT